MKEQMFNSLSDEQKEFVKAAEFMLHSSTRAYLLTGGPGTGKSYAISYLLKHIFSKEKVLITAPTNKATLNLANMMDDSIDNNNYGVMTTHKALQLKMKDDAEVLQIGNYGNSKEAPINQCDICIIDEGSMVNSEICAMIIKSLKTNPSLKLIIVGDKDQLFPPKEYSSPLMDCVGEEFTTHLVKNNRFGDDSNIDKHVKLIKKSINTKEYNLTIMDDKSIQPGNVINIKNIFVLIKKFPQFFDNENNRILTWTRDQFKMYNQAIREHKLGADVANKHKLIKGERFISYTTNHDENIFIGDEGVVEKFKNKDYHATLNSELGIKIPCIEMYVTLDNGQSSIIYTLDKKNQALMERHAVVLKKHAIGAKKFEAKKLWKKYWCLVNSFHEVEPAYAQTIHSSQGSTYNNVIVDIPNIMKCRDLETCWRLLYVAFSRAKNVVMVNV